MTCCVVIPTYKSFESCNESEKISIQQALNIFKERTIFLVHPKSMSVNSYRLYFEKFNIVLNAVSFDDRYFNSTVSYSKMMLSTKFYKRFLEFDYLLIYQTDAFVFEDRIEEWCEKKYSYVGAPWFKGFLPPEASDELFLVGNGGFSLRKISDCLKALKSFSFTFPFSYVWQTQFSKKSNSVMRNALVFAKRILLGNNSFWRLNDFHKYNNNHNTFQEDYFWGVICKKNFEWFTVPEPLEALGFSFEVMPEKMFELNHHQLPMGVHAWERYNPSFWRPFITRLGYKTPL